MSEAERQPAVPKPNVRWFHLAPDRFVALSYLPNLMFYRP
jgi:hypothetical protein